MKEGSKVNVEEAPEEAPSMFHKPTITDTGEIKNDTNKDKQMIEGKNRHHSHSLKEQDRHE